MPAAPDTPDVPDAPADASDSDLLRRYADARDESAFREFVHRHLPFVYTTALRRCLGDTHRAEEIAQTVFTDLASKAARLSRHTALAGWLHTSTRFAASTVSRTEHRRLLRETEALAMQENSPTPTLAPSWTDLRPVIDHALDQLAARDRETLLLRFFENQPPLDAAQHAALSTAYREAAHPHVPGKERNLVLGSEYGPDRYGPSLDAKIEQLAAPILSPEQSAALASHHRDSRAQSEIRSRVQEMVSAADHPHPHN